MTPDEMLSAAIAVAEEGLAAGELPIGAVVVLGDEVVGRAFTEDLGRKRRLVHADLLAMIEADERLGWGRRVQPLRLAVNLEPCVMCLGAAMALGVTEVYFGLESPADGAAGIAAAWQPTSADLPGYAPPVMVGGLRREECREQFSRYCRTAPDSGFRRWAQTLADLPD
ncbi:nucleoside deaminase [Streptacidiphilus sp. N1-12]|uniref:Nucleoside deaminase n=2 Tax=Streptacidiphilus alkalitolerans TaxID=3342712 RepID=A0ABV6V4W2_9ACTN